MLNIPTVNLEEELLKQNSRKVSQEDLIIKEVENIFEKNDEEAASILESVGLGDNIKKYHKIKKQRHDLDDLNSNRVFHVDQIKKICINYGLRFLPTSQYKGTVDYTAVAKIKEFQSKSKRSDQQFFMVAPKSSFKLEEKPKDPLLFAKIDNDYYYLIHKWGNDLSAIRWYTNLPFRSIGTVLLSIPLLGLIVSTILGLIIGGPWVFWAFAAPFIFCIIALFAVAIGGEFPESNTDTWDSEFE